MRVRPARAFLAADCEHDEHFNQGGDVCFSPTTCKINPEPPTAGNLSHTCPNVKVLSLNFTAAADASGLTHGLLWGPACSHVNNNSQNRLTGGSFIALAGLMSYFRNVALIFPMWQRRRDSQTPPGRAAKWVLGIFFRRVSLKCRLKCWCTFMPPDHPRSSGWAIGSKTRECSVALFSFFLLHSWRSGRILCCDCTAKQPPPTWILKRSLNGSNALRCPLVTTLLLLPPPLLCLLLSTSQCAAVV